MPDFIQLFGLANARLIFKIGFLIIVGLFVIFSFMLLTKVRALNRVIFLPPEAGKIVLQILTVLYFLVVLSLFFLTIVIV